MNAEPLFQFQPLSDPRWNRFLRDHPRSSVFHTAEWLDALRRVYRYEPVAFTTCPPGTTLRNAAVFCRVESWLTGNRLVSLPFSDHCDLLADTAPERAALIEGLEREMVREKLKYIELRPTRSLPEGNFGSSTSPYCLHQLDVSPDLETLLHNCHKDSTQRKIRRAQREGLTYIEGCSTSLLDDFYRMLLLTRRRHLVPPQPRKWFEALLHSFGEALKIRVAFLNCRPIAGILTIRHKDTLLYKYACSDAQYHNLGGIHMLIWSAIRDAKEHGLHVFDFGRSDCTNTGLMTFKDRWGARRSLLTYMRLLRPGYSRRALMTGGVWQKQAARAVLRQLPDVAFSSLGNLIYRHIG